LPRFEEHLGEVETLLKDKPDEAARRLFRFSVLDPACGSAHFLVAVVDELADRLSRFLADHPLPAVTRELDDLRAGAGATYGIGIDDAQLLKRLVLRRCVYGVDLSAMGVEIAKISLWLASFVPGLSLSYLDHNVKQGNSLIGIASPDQLLDADGATTLPAMLVAEQMEAAAEAAEEFYGLMDRTPDEFAQSEQTEQKVESKVEGARLLLDIWAAGPLGLDDARRDLWPAAEAIREGTIPTVAEPANELARSNHVFHWPLEFPEVFAEKRGFDVVVGNPPWEEVTVEELAFYARYEPGLRGLADAERRRALDRLKEERPELAARLATEVESARAMRAFFAAETGYVGGAGDPDLYKFFCQRYRRLLARGGALAVVLPRSAFSAKGSAHFRSWLFGDSTVRRLDFLLNSGRWAFDAEPRYTVALLIAESAPPPGEHRLEVAGVADSSESFQVQSNAAGLSLGISALGAEFEVPLLPTQDAADLLEKLGTGPRFPFGANRWRCFPVMEFDETLDKKLWEGAEEGWELWKGESFDQYDPRGTGTRPCPPSDGALKKAHKPRPGADSLLASDLTAIERARVVATELQRARVVYRRVSRSTDSRTIRAALVPKNVFLTNAAPYLAFVEDRAADRACCLGLLNSLVFDWQARRFVETNVNYFILEGLRLPTLSDDSYVAISNAAARLSSVDLRFADFAESTGVEAGPLQRSERDELRAEIDARTARAWNLAGEDLETVFADFTLDAVPESYRQRVRDRFAELIAE
jgi:hypothetical protein